MPRLRMRSEVYGGVFVCVCVECYSRSMINKMQVRASIGFFIGLQFVDLHASSRVIARFACLEAIVVFSEQCVAILCLVVSSALEC